MEYYQNPIEETLYRKLNKDQSVNRNFQARRVGKCVKLFDDYFQSVSAITPSDWESYYFESAGIDGYINAVNNISGICSDLDKGTINDYVHFRIIGQTWNGFINELNVIREIQNDFPNIDFRKANYELDESYFTDWEAYVNDMLLFGIQIKPITYKYMNTPYQMRAKENHEVQRELYKKEFGVPHYLFYYQDNRLYDKEYIINQINTSLALKIQVNR